MNKQQIRDLTTLSKHTFQDEFGDPIFGKTDDIYRQQLIT